MPSLEAKNVQFGPCIVKLNGTQYVQCKDGVAIVVKKATMDQKDDALGAGVVDRWGTGVSAASIELEVVNMSRAALAKIMNKAATTNQAGTKYGVWVNAEDDMGQSQYELSQPLEVFKTKNGIAATAPVCMMPFAYGLMEANITIGAEKQGIIKVTYNGYAARTAGSFNGLAWSVSDLIWLAEILSYGSV